MFLYLKFEIITSFLNTFLTLFLPNLSDFSILQDLSLKHKPIYLVEL